jgi:hypothetical protein
MFKIWTKGEGTIKTGYNIGFSFQDSGREVNLAQLSSKIEIHMDVREIVTADVVILPGDVLVELDPTCVSIATEDGKKVKCITIDLDDGETIVIGEKEEGE